jgi:hypothetical protein
MATKSFTDFHRLEIKTFKTFERCEDDLVKDPKKRVLGKDSTQVGFSIEKDLVARIDQFARRDCISRSSWMREALIDAWREAKEFKRTPLHGYLATPIELPSAQVDEEPVQTKKSRSKA